MNGRKFERRRVVQEHCQELQNDSTLVLTRCVMVCETLPSPFASMTSETTERRSFCRCSKADSLPCLHPTSKNSLCWRGVEELAWGIWAFMNIYQTGLTRSLPVKWGRPGRPRARAGLSRQNNGMFTIVCSDCENETFLHRNIWWKPPTVTSKTD